MYLRVDTSSDRPTINPDILAPRIYIGKLANWEPYAKDELFIIVIPGNISEGSPVYAFFQWEQDSTGSRKVNAMTVGKMKDVKNVGDCMSFTFPNDLGAYYTFHVLKVDEHLRRLTLEMKNPYGESTGGLTFYLQNLDPPSASLRRRPALWDGTPESGTTKVESSATEIETRTTEVEIGTTEVGNRTTKVENSATEIETRTTEVENRTIEVENSATEVTNWTTEVENNTDEVIICSLQDSGSPPTDVFLATAGFILGSIGLIAAIPTSGVSPNVGLFLAGIGWAGAVGGAVQVFNPTGGGVAEPMFPRDTMQRTSAGSITVSNNDLYINLVRVDSSRRHLIITGATIDKTGDNKIKLKDHIPGAKGAPRYQELFQMDLPNPMRLISYRNIVVHMLNCPRGATRGIHKIKEKDFVNALITVDTQTGDKKWYSTLGDYNALMIKSKPGSVMFNYTPQSDLVFSEGIPQNGIGATRATALTCHGEKRKCILLKLINCKVVMPPSKMIFLGEYVTEEDVFAAIKKRPLAYQGFQWLADHSLHGYVPEIPGTTVVVSRNANDCVYLVSASWRPINALLNAND